MQRVGRRAQVLSFRDGAEGGERIERQTGHWLAHLTSMVQNYRFHGEHWRVNLTSVNNEGEREMPHTNEALPPFGLPSPGRR
jgi:hypothetical protein